MSHIVDMEVSIQDLEALKASCPALGLEFLENQRTHKSYFQGQCDHAIRVVGNERAYEIGVVKNVVGSGYKLVADPYDGGYGLMEKIGGQQAGLLKQEYAAQVSTRALGRGWRTVRTKLDDGRVVLRCKR